MGQDLAFGPTAETPRVAQNTLHRARLPDRMDPPVIPSRRGIQQIGADTRTPLDSLCLRSSHPLHWHADPFTQSSSSREIRWAELTARAHRAGSPHLYSAPAPHASDSADP